MALSDCPKCWDTPCTCGYMYKDWTDEKISDFVGNILSGVTYYKSIDNEDKDVKFLKTVFLTSPTTGKKLKIKNVSTSNKNTDFVITTRNDEEMWKCTVKIEETSNGKRGKLGDK